MLVNFVPRGVVVITNKELKQYLEEIVKRYHTIEQRLDRIEQLVMKFWDVPESGYDVLDEEKEQPQK